MRISKSVTNDGVKPMMGSGWLLTILKFSEPREDYYNLAESALEINPIYAIAAQNLKILEQGKDIDLTKIGVAEVNSAL